MKGRRPDLSHEAIRFRKRAVATMTEQGMSAHQIALHLGITDRSVIRIRSRLGIAQPAQIPMTEAEKTRAAELFADGCSRNEVARTIGRSYTTLAVHFPQQCWRRGEGASLALLERRVWERLEAISA